MTKSNGQEPERSYEGKKRGQKRTKTQRQHDRALIAEMYFRHGMIGADIARKLNDRDYVDYSLSKRMVSYEVEKIVLDYGQEQEPNFWIKEEIMRLNMIETEAWAAWDRSLQPKERTVTKEGSNNFGQYDEVQTLVEQRVGDKRFLDVILDCIEKRNRLRGIGGINMKIEQTTEHIIKTYAKVSPSDWDEQPAIEGEVVGQERLEDGSSD